MSDLVRVKDKRTGAEETVSRAWLDLNPDAYTELKDKEAVDVNGRILPAKINRQFAGLATDGGTPATKAGTVKTKEA